MHVNCNHFCHRLFLSLRNEHLMTHCSVLKEKKIERKETTTKKGKKKGNTNHTKISQQTLEFKHKEDQDIVKLH